MAAMARKRKSKPSAPPTGAKKPRSKSEPGPETPKPKAQIHRISAEELAKKQREISVSEFFAKNRHLLGFDNPTRALLTAVKEAVDNSLDACEESGILPEIIVEIRQTGEDPGGVT